MKSCARSWRLTIQLTLDYNALQWNYRYDGHAVIWTPKLCVGVKPRLPARVLWFFFIAFKWQSQLLDVVVQTMIRVLQVCIRNVSL